VGSPNLQISRPPAHLLSVSDLAAEGIADVVEHALALKANWFAGARLLPAAALPLAGHAVALIFDKPSLRTRVSFEVGIARLGGTTSVLPGDAVGLGSREPMADIARTLSRYVDAIVIRMLSHAAVAELAAASDVPVINALTEHEHPCQALADLLTIREHLGSLRGRRIAYVGDGNNVCHSLLLAAAAVGMDVRVATPAARQPAATIVDEAVALARESGGRVLLTEDARAAVAGVEAVYTDVWASMGEEHLARQRRQAFAGYTLDADLLQSAPNALVMHCLPAHRGEEIAGEVLDGPQSVVFDQAENRLWAQQAVILRLLRPARASAPPRAVDKRAFAAVVASG
jgi:ornithine carbamoyltransferase